MKKKILFISLVISLVMLAPFKVVAKKYYDGYETKNFKQTLEAEGMTIKNKDYKETDKQATIYLFRGQGCGFCQNFITFLNSISKEYGKYFKVVSFEVWNNAENSELMGKIGYVTGEEAGGVPYIVIGKKVFPGYISDWDDEIKDTIKKQYNDNSYDVFKELEKMEQDPSFEEKYAEYVNSKSVEETEEGDATTYGKTSSSDTSNTGVVIWNLVFIAIATVSIICTIIIHNNKILRAIESGNISSKKGKK